MLFGVISQCIDQKDWRHSYSATPHPKGLAKAMLTHLLGVVKAANGENVFLEVRQSNLAAIHLYTAFDFVETGVRKNYYPSEFGREDAILMALSF